MNQFTFSSGRDFNLSDFTTTSDKNNAAPYEPTLRFNEVIDRSRTDTKDITYSINPEEILKVIEKDELNALYQITLGGKSARDGTGLWDVLFNASVKKSLTACLFTAQADFTPIPRHRVPFTSSYLNYTMYVSRLHLNQIILGDRLGIAIRDMRTRMQYVLLYVVDSFCWTNASVPTSEERGGMIPSINIRMEHAVRIDTQGRTTLVDMEEGVEYDAERANPFVSRLVNGVNQIVDAYPWKPHYVVRTMPSVKRKDLETRFAERSAEATPISYEEFDKISRKAYQEAKVRHKNNPNRGKPRGARSPQNRREIELPTVEIFQQEGRFYATFDDASDPTGTMYQVDFSDAGSALKAETFLTGDDLLNVPNLKENNTVMLLSPQFGENATLRYFTLNF